MLNNPWIFVVLMIIAGLGLMLGFYYYLRPDLVVQRRIKQEHRDTAKKDPDFRKWLNTEIQTQVKRVRRMGLIFIVLETIWLILIFGLYRNAKGL